MNSKQVIQEIRTLLGFSEEPATEVQCSEATLTDGTVIKWEGDLTIGTAITVVTAEGEIPAPDAIHETEDGDLITTVGGVVTDIVEPSEEVAPMMPQDMSQEFATIEKFNELVDRIEAKQLEIDAKFSEILEKLSSQSSAFSKTIDLVEKIADLPSELPIEAPEKMSKKDIKFANITKIAQQLKNK